MSPIGTIEHHVGFVFAGIQNSSGGRSERCRRRERDRWLRFRLFPRRSWSSPAEEPEAPLAPRWAPTVVVLPTSTPWRGPHSACLETWGKADGWQVRGNTTYPGSDPTTVAESYSCYKSL